MFDGLDQIDWTSIGHHVYGGKEKIPDAIRNLLSSNPDVRDEAREFLLGGGQDFGDIYDTTHHIIPFIIELLSSFHAPGKADSLDHLSSIARHIWDSENLSVRMMRLHIKTYDSLKRGLQTFISLLDDDSIAVRLATIDLLQYLTDEVEVLIPEFIRRCNDEKEEDVQVALLRGLKLLLSSLEWIQSELKEQCEPFLNEIIETHLSQRVQVAGAQTSVEIFEKYTRRKRSLSPKVENLLSNEFLRISKTIDHNGWSEEFDLAIGIIKDLVKLDAADHFLDMLRNPEITPVQVHLISRGLLAIFITYTDDAYWKCRRNYDVKDKELNYVHSYPLSHNLRIFLAQRKHFEPRIRLLEAIVENQTFWEIPTNMFSFFVGLPDSREELRAILKSTP